MNINKFVLSIVKRPSFNLLAFQGLTFISLLLASLMVVLENTIIFRYELWAVIEYCILYILLLGIPVLLYTLIVFVIKALLNRLTTLIYNKYLTIGNFIIFLILLNIAVFREYYGLPAETLASGVLFMVAIISIIAVYSIIGFSIIPLIITLITEQIRGTRIENLPYLDSKLKLTSVVFFFFFPIIFWSFIAIKLIYF